MGQRPEKVVLPRGRFFALLALFGTLYFAQGINEPTAGLMHQPLQARLNDWGIAATDIGRWMALVSLPWSFKPVFGLLSDFFPLFGYRRWSYLVLATAGTFAAVMVLALMPFESAALQRSFLLLFFAAMGIAVSDVVIDALAVENGQPLGITGQLQSVQWGAMSVASIAVGLLGGYLSAHQWIQTGFLICAGLAAISVAMSLVVVREPRQEAPLRASVGDALRGLWRSARLPLVWSVGGFLFLWNFNPFSSTVQQLYMTETLGWSEQFYGNFYSVQSVAQVVACVLYGFYCRRVRFRLLVHASIAMGVLSTLAYWAMYDQRSAVVVALAVGFSYMTGTLIQLDLAARVCPIQSAGTMFALLMAISNTGLSAGYFAGGQIYDLLATQFNSRHVAFDALVGIGAACTATCWLLVPVMQHAQKVGRSSAPPEK